MPGWGRRSAQDAIAETGIDMTRFRTPAHLVSWAGRSPLEQQSAGKNTRRAKARKGNRYLAGVLGETAISAGRTQTREGARYRRLARRRGKAKAQVALGNTQLKVYHALLSHPGLCYQDLGAGYYDRRNTVVLFSGQPGCFRANSRSRTERLRALSLLRGMPEAHAAALLGLGLGRAHHLGL